MERSASSGELVAVSLAQTFQERRDHFQTLRLGEYLDPRNASIYDEALGCREGRSPDWGISRIWTGPLVLKI